MYGGCGAAACEDRDVLECFGGWMELSLTGCGRVIGLREGGVEYVCEE